MLSGVECCLVFRIHIPKTVDKAPFSVTLKIHLQGVTFLFFFFAVSFLLSLLLGALALCFAYSSLAGGTLFGVGGAGGMLFGVGGLLFVDSSVLSSVVLTGYHLPALQNGNFGVSCLLIILLILSSILVSQIDNIKI